MSFGNLRLTVTFFMRSIFVLAINDGILSQAHILPWIGRWQPKQSVIRLFS